VNYTKEILKTAGMSPERVQLFSCSAAEGQKFQEEVTRISKIIEDLGSNPIKESIKADKQEKDSKEIKKKK
jgi:coenzyme F420-reducing hydrogenase delta subunit